MPRVRLLIGINGEDCTGWQPGDVKDCSEQYARYLLARKGAVLVEGEIAEEAAGLATAKVAPVNRMAKVPRGR